MQKTRKEALDEFLGWVGELGDDVARDVAERALTRAVDAIWLKHPWRDYQSPDPLQLTLVAGQRSYPLPDFYGRPGKGKVRNLTSGLELFPVNEDDADTMYPARGTTLEAASSPRHYLLGGIVGVQRQPLVTGQALEVLSTSADDSTNLRATIVGSDASGNMRRLQVTLNGTTPVAAGTFSYVDEFGKGYRESVDPTTEGTSSEGTISLRITSSATVLQQLFPEESAREHRVVTLIPKPATAEVIAFPVMRRPPRLLYDADPMPGDWWNAIFEELTIQWRVNRGELAVDSMVPRPALMDLVANDNANGPRRRVQPFTV